MTVADSAGNLSTQESDVFTIDNTKPTLAPITVVSSNLADTKLANNGDLVTLTVTSNEKLSGVAINSLTSGVAGVLHGITATPIAMTNTDGAPGLVWAYSFTVANNDPDGRITFALTATDVAGNTQTASGTTDVNVKVDVDNSAPTVSGKITITPDNTVNNNNMLNNTTASLTVVTDFSETMDQTVPPTFAFGGGIEADLVAGAGSWTSATRYTKAFTVNHTSLLSATNYTLRVTGAQDLASNTMTQYDSTGISADQVLPTLTTVTPSFSTIAGTYYESHGSKKLINRSMIGTEVYFDFTFNSNMDQSVPPTVATTNDVSGAFIAPVTGVSGWQTATTYRKYYKIADVSNVEELDVDVTIGAVKDLAGNVINGTANSVADIFTVDLIAPTLTFESIDGGTNGDNYIKNGESARLIFSYDQALDLNHASDVKQIAGQTASSWAPNSGNVEVYYYIPANENTLIEGALSYEVKVADYCGNMSNTISNAASTLIYDRTLPTCAIARVNQTVGNASNGKTNADAVQFTLTFNEPLINFDATDITINKQAATTVNCDAFGPGGSTLTGPVGNVYTVTLNNVTGDGTLGITVDKTAFTDRATNAMLANSVSPLYTIDNTAPIVYSVEVNCNNTPLIGYEVNKAARVTFSEPVYRTTTATTAITSSDIEIIQTSPDGATLTSWAVIGSPAAGLTSVNVSLVMNGTILGNEKVRADKTVGGVIYDEAGNAMARVGAITGVPTSLPNNWGYAKADLSVQTQPVSRQICETSTTTLNIAAIGGLSVTYQWQYKKVGDLAFTDVPASATFTNTQSSILGINTPSYTTYNGTQFRCRVLNDCGNPINSDTVLLTLYKATAITTQPTSPVSYICEGAANTATISVVAEGRNLSYQWEYSSTGVAPWFPMGLNQNSYTLPIEALPGTYYYHVIVTGDCSAPLTSDPVGVTVSPLPTASLVLGGTGTICYNSSTNITVAGSQVGVRYQLRNATTHANIVDQAPVNGNNGSINLPTGYLTAPTTFEVFATNITTGCTQLLTETETVSIEATPVSPTLLAKTPNTALVCQGSSVSATFTAGSGGASDAYQYTTDGTNYFAYTPGATITAAANTVTIQGRRLGTTCSPTAWTTLASWNVELTPVAPTITKSPVAAAVCAGTNVSATFAGGSGGLANSYEYRTNGGSWAAYTAGTPIATTPNITSVEVRASRTTTTCTSVNNLASWTVNALPTATISGTTSICNGSSTNLNVVLTGTGPWSIVYTDGVTPTTINGIAASPRTINVNPSSNKTYTITSVTDVNCTNSGAGSAVITVTSPATADAGPATASICQGSTYSLSGASASNYSSVAWTTNGQGHFTDASILNSTYVPAGTDFGTTVNLTLTAHGNSPCGNATDVLALTVNATPTATASNNGPVCETGTINLSTPLVAGATYTWSGPDGFGSTSRTPSIANATTAKGGVYTVFVLNNGCTNSSTTNVVVNPKPAASGAIATGPHTVNAGDNNVAYTVGSIANATSYVWSYSGTNAPITGNGTSITINFAGNATSGDLTVYGHNDCGDGAVSATYHIDVNMFSVPSITGAPAPQTICQNGSTSFSVTGVSGNPAPSKKWQYSANGTSNWVDLTIAAPFSTSIDGLTLFVTNATQTSISGYYKLVATNTQGTRNSDSAQLIVNEAPANAGVPSTALEVCSGTGVTITPNVVAGVTYKYYDALINGNQLPAPGAPASASYSTGNLVASTTVYVEAIKGSCVASARTAVAITVNPLPANAIANAVSTCSGSTATVTPTVIAGIGYRYYTALTGGTLKGSGDSYTTGNLTADTTLFVEAYNIAKGCIAAARTSVLVTVNGAAAQPDAIVQAPAGAITAGSTYTYTVTGLAGHTYTWTVPSGWTINSGQTTNSINVTSTATTGDITVIANRCGASPARTLTVAPLAANPGANSTLTMTSRGRTSISLRVNKGAATTNSRIILAKFNSIQPPTVIIPADADNSGIADGIAYTANTTFANVASAVANGWYVVYNGNDTLTTVNGLTMNKAYAFAVYEYNGTGASSNYVTGPVTTTVFKTSTKDGEEIGTDAITNSFEVSAISPNPATTDINFNVNASEGGRFTIELFNESGQLAFSKPYDLNTGNNQISIDLFTVKGKISAGVYYLKVNMGGESISKQVVVNP